MHVALLAQSWLLRHGLVRAKTPDDCWCGSRLLVGKQPMPRARVMPTIIWGQ